MSVLIHAMMSQNYDIKQWRSFSQAGVEGATALVRSSLFVSRTNMSRGDDKMARLLFTSMSHNETVDLMVQEWDYLDPFVRTLFSDLCNTSHSSNSVTKNVQRLNKLLNGKLLKEKASLKSADGKEVNQAVAGAMRKYAAGVGKEPKRKGK